MIQHIRHSRRGLFNFDTLRNKIIAISTTILSLSIIGGAIGWISVQATEWNNNNIKKVATIVCEDLVSPVCKTVTETNYILREIVDSTTVQRAMQKMKNDSVSLSLQSRR